MISFAIADPAFIAKILNRIPMLFFEKKIVIALIIFDIMLPAFLYCCRHIYFKRNQSSNKSSIQVGDVFLEMNESFPYISRIIFNSRNDENAGSDNMMLSKSVIVQLCIKMSIMSFIA